MSRRAPQDVFQVFGAALSSFFGWMLIYLAVWSLGVGVGVAIAKQSILSLGSVVLGPFALFGLPFAAFTDIWLMTGALLVPACWALPLYFDWHRPRPVFLLIMLPVAMRMGYWIGSW